MPGKEWNNSHSDIAGNHINDKMQPYHDGQTGINRWSYLLKKVICICIGVTVMVPGTVETQVTTIKEVAGDKYEL